MRGRGGTVVAAGWAASAAAIALVFYQSAFGHPLTDFSVYRMGGSDVLHGRDVYRSTLPRYGLPFTYPPFAAVMFAPLAALPRILAQLAWNAGNVTALLVIVRTAARRITTPATSPVSSVLLALPVSFGAAFWLEPVRHTFALGQVNLLVVLLCFRDLSFGHTSRVPQGLRIGIAAALKLTPLIFLPYLLLTRRRTAAGWAVAGFLGASAVGLLAGLRVSWTFWHSYALSVAHVGGIPYVGNQSLTGDVTRWLGHIPSGPAWNSFVAGAGFAGLLIARRLYAGGQSLPADCVAGLTGLLVSPVSWSHHFIWIVPALMCLATSTNSGRRAVAGICAVIFYAAPIWWVPATHDREFHHHGWQLVAACSFSVTLVMLIATLTRSPSRSRITAPEVVRFDGCGGQPTSPWGRQPS